MIHSVPRINPQPTWPLTHNRLHRVFRVGASPVLEVTVTYPALSPAEDGIGTEALRSAVHRFNRAYQQMADTWLAWTQEAPLETAMAAFAAAGAAAAYRFDRRVLVCDMLAAYAPADEPTRLTVTRTLKSESRRGELSPRSLTATDIWRWPELTLVPPRKNRIQFHKKTENWEKTIEI